MVQIRPGYKVLPGSERHARAPRVENADTTASLSVSIYLRRPPDAPPLLDHAHWIATPPKRRTFLSRQQLAQQNGAAQVDLDLVRVFANARHLSVDEVNIARRHIVLSGTVAQMNDAFGVDLAMYGSGLDAYRGREGPIQIPLELADVVEGVFGLDTRRVAPPPAAAPPFKTEKNGGAFLSPDIVAQLYDFPPVRRNIADQCIAVFAFCDPNDPHAGTGGYRDDDIRAYFETYQGVGPGIGCPAVRSIRVKGPGNVPNADPGVDDYEITGDIQVAGAVAPGVGISVYATTWDEDGWLRAIKRVIYPNEGEPECSIISISAGAPEFAVDTKITWSSAAVQLISQAFQEAAQAGITIVAASGDYGSSCGMAPPRARVLYPASDPWVTACGGTVIKNLSGSSFSEATWVHTGGGISEIFPLPPWQANADILPSATKSGLGRGIPDIAGYANGYCIVIGGKRVGPIAGTSGVAPFYAGMIARINAAIDHNIGFLNPTLYELGSNSGGMFRDIADGASNTSGGAPGYTSVSGWNACNGWGSINGTELMRFL